jgi:hypothetical protein
MLGSRATLSPSSPSSSTEDVRWTAAAAAAPPISLSPAPSQAPAPRHSAAAARANGGTGRVSLGKLGRVVGARLQPCARAPDHGLTQRELHAFEPIGIQVCFKFEVAPTGAGAGATGQDGSLGVHDRVRRAFGIGYVMHCEPCFLVRRREGATGSDSEGEGGGERISFNANSRRPLSGTRNKHYGQSYDTLDLAMPQAALERAYALCCARVGSVSPLTQMACPRAYCLVACLDFVVSCCTLGYAPRGACSSVTAQDLDTGCARAPVACCCCVGMCYRAGPEPCTRPCAPGEHTVHCGQLTAEALSCWPAWAVQTVRVGAYTNPRWMTPTQVMQATLPLAVSSTRYVCANKHSGNSSDLEGDGDGDDDDDDGDGMRALLGATTLPRRARYGDS